MRPILSICIPTFNKEKNLNECLDSLFLQIKDRKEIEVIVSDNCSIDKTKEVVYEFIKKSQNIHYQCNDENLGFDGNTVKCIRSARGEYVALLSADDRYLENTIDKILPNIKGKKYSLILLNYYGFWNNFKNPNVYYAPLNDVIFTRGYDIMNYPSVGHFSGFIYNTKLANFYLDQILEEEQLITKDRSRGIYLAVAAYVTLKSNHPSYFLGQPLLATKMDFKADYNKLESNILHYYKIFHHFYKKGIITKNDLVYRTKLVLSLMPRNIISSTPYMEPNQINNLILEFKSYFSSNKKFNFICKPLLYASKNKLLRFLFRIATSLNLVIKKSYFHLKYG